MPDGKRKRRHSGNTAKRQWYAVHRSSRFCRRFGWLGPATSLSRSGPFQFVSLTILSGASPSFAATGSG